MEIQMTYPKINAPYKRWQKSLHTLDMLPEGTKYGDFKIGEFASEEFKYLFNNDWIWTEKLDGCNIRIYIKEGNITIGGRSDNSSIPQDLYKWIYDWYGENDIALHNQFPGGVVFYGEGVGNKIQKGGELFGEQHFKLFDVYIDGFWLKPHAVVAIATQFNLSSPIPWVGTIQQAIETVQKEPTSMYGDFTIEGFVGKPLIRLSNAKGERIITKIKVKDFR